MRFLRTAAALAVVALAAACQGPDVGQRCALRTGSGTTEPTPQSVSGDLLETGNAACDDFVCIVSPAPTGSRYGSCANGDTMCGYCSKPCVSNQDCFQSKTGLVCRQMVLDPAFIAQLQQTDPALAQKYLADITFSSYCAIP